MRNVLISSLFLFISLYAVGQVSEIKSDSSNKNKLKVHQTGGKDSNQKSTINLSKSDSNQVEVVQGAPVSEAEKKDGNFEDWIKNTDNLLKVLLSFCALVGAVWGGWKALKEWKKKQP